MDDDSYWTMVIRPRSEWFDIEIKELWSYRDLIMLFVHRNIVSTYKQTILGPLWFLLQPVLTTLVFIIIFGNIARIPTDGAPKLLFYMVGVVTWTFFSNCVIQTSNTFSSNAAIFGKVYFPRLVIPISVVITNLFTFAIQFILFLLFFTYYYVFGSGIHPTIWILTIPFLLIQMAFLGLGSGILISSMTTKYRDLALLLGFGIQLWMYATPIVYPLSQIPEKWQWLFAMNPMTAIVETFRNAFLGNGIIMPWILGVSIGMTLIIFISGILYFHQVEKMFIDTV